MINGCGRDSLPQTGTAPIRSAVVIYSDPGAPTVRFAVKKLKESLLESGYPVTTAPLDLWQTSDAAMKIVLFHSSTASADAAPEPSETLRPEGFRLSGHIPEIRIEGFDDPGVMYGGLELAEQIRLYGLENIQPGTHNPYLEKRGTKFNVPLDARTPSYSDMSDVAQRNMTDIWRYEFWTEYLDRLATDRYNFVSLWNLHPFPSMVRVPDYPDIALDDVKQIQGGFKEYYSTRAEDYDDPGLLKNMTTLIEMTIDEKIAFWQKVMRYAADRNIRFYVITWNIYDYGINGKYGITDDIHNPVTADYFRKSVREMFNTYPLLAGIGVTTGENMPDAGFEEKEEWVYKTYGMGLLEAARAQPRHRFTFIHRQHEARTQDIARRFGDLLKQDNIDFIFSFKYAQAHVYSSIRQNFHRDFVNEIGGMKTLWGLRNDDIYLYRWGAPDFVRDFIVNIPREVGRGYYYGSDQYVWGREFLSNSPRSPRELELSKHWYQWLLWGRLGYEPQLSNERLMGILQYRFPEVQAPMLFSAWQAASMVYPIVTGFHWGQYDFQWYIEACKSRPGPARTESGFHDVNRFITLPPHPDTDYVSIPDYVAALTAGKTLTGTTPPRVAALLHEQMDRALNLLRSLKAGDGASQQDSQLQDIPHHDTLKDTLADIETMAMLGKYYAHKIQGATELALFRASGKPVHRQQAVEQLTLAAVFWEKYTQLSAQRYTNPFWTNRVGYVDWQTLSREVVNDIKIATNAAAPNAATIAN